MRRESNNKLLKILDNYLLQNPDIRFNQALINLKIVLPEKDLFYEESKETLKRLENKQFAILCPSEEECTKLLKFLDTKNYKWRSGQNIPDIVNVWDGISTVIFINNDMISHGDTSYLKYHPMSTITVTEFITKLS